MAWNAKTPLPDAWAVCNGQNGTPDLRDRFLKGVGDPAEAGKFEEDEWRRLTVRYDSIHESKLEADGVKFTVPVNGESPAGFTGEQTGPTVRVQHFSYDPAGKTRPKNMAVIYIMKVR